MKSLPRTYWIFAFIGLLFALACGAALGISIGVNPYISASVIGGVFVLAETCALRLKGY